MKAVIMAGGQGTRLRPLTSNQPKPMLPIVNRPIMEHIVDLLARHGFTEQIATVQFLVERHPVVLRQRRGPRRPADLRDRRDAPRDGRQREERARTSSATRRFVVISGDALTDIDLTKLVAFHRRRAPSRRSV